MYAHIVYKCLNIFYVSNVLLSSKVESFTLKLKLLMKSALSLIFCMCIHNSKICLMHLTCKLIMSH